MGPVTHKPTPIELARRELAAGVREATGQNDGVPAERYNDGEEKAWCAAFVRYCFEQCGTKLPGLRHELPAVKYMEAQLEAAGARVAEPEPGDIVTFRWSDGSRHVGLVEHVFRPTKTRPTIQTIEGNAANAVRRRSYALGARSITGYFRWPLP